METPPNDQPKYTKLARQIYARLPNSRDYALSDTEAISLGAFAPAWNEENSFASDTGGHEKFGEALRELGEYVPTLFQVRPSDPPPSPQVWRDPVSNEALPNPWLQKNLKAQSILEKRDPLLAAHFREMAADAYGYLARLQDEAAKRARLKAVKYTANTHKTNSFVNGSLTDQSRFAAMSPELAQFFKAEAEPVKLPFGVNGNMTERGQITRNPKLKAIADRADEIVALWKEAERRKLMAAKAEAEKQLKALEAK